MSNIIDPWDELHQCELYRGLLPRYKRVIDWAFEQYNSISREDKVSAVVAEISDKGSNGAFKLEMDSNVLISRRELLGLDELDFNFGVHFHSNEFMPYFGVNETALFGHRDTEFGDICFVGSPGTQEYWLATREETGWFELGGEYLGEYEDLNIFGTLVNIRTA